MYVREFLGACTYKRWQNIVDTYLALAEEATKSKEATFLNWSDFLLQKLQSYGEALNLRGAMAPVAPLFPPPVVPSHL